MRFRTKFGSPGCVLVALAAFYAWLGFFRIHPPGDARSFQFMAFAFALGALAQALKCAFLSWDLDAAGITERRFWMKKEIAWKEVTCVLFKPKWLFGGAIDVYFARPSRPFRGYLRVYPENYAEFVGTLNRLSGSPGVEGK